MRGAVVGFGEIEDVGNEPLLIHAVGGSGIIARDDQAAVLGGLLDRLRARSSVACHAAGKDPGVGIDVFRPVHRAAGDDDVIGSEIHGARAGVGRDSGREGQRCEGKRYCGVRERRTAT